MFLKVMKILRIGNIFWATGGSFAGNIYRSDGLCPTINTAGGDREPMILEYDSRRNHREATSGGKHPE